MTTNQIYYKGDLAEWTGESRVFYGVIFYAWTLLEGHKKGEVVWTATAPEAKGEV